MPREFRVTRATCARCGGTHQPVKHVVANVLATVKTVASPPLTALADALKARRALNTPEGRAAALRRHLEGRTDENPD